MRNHLLIFICFFSAQVFAQQAGNKDFIFDPAITQQYRTSFDEIIAVMANYYEGVEYSDREKLTAAFHGSWQMRDNDGTDNNFIHIEDKQTFIERVENHGNYEDYASQRKIGALEVIHDQLAFVRIDKSPTRSATLFFLAKMNGVWMIIDKLWVYQEENYNALPTNELLTSIQNFYDGQGMDKDFDSRLVSDGSYEIEVQSQLADHSTKLVSILGVYDRLAVVRTDYPLLNTTAYIVLFRLDSGWTVACERISQKK
nr:nuclear transport factor 2 family protein [Allomuricauda sp.]